MQIEKVEKYETHQSSFKIQQHLKGGQYDSKLVRYTATATDTL